MKLYTEGNKKLIRKMSLGTLEKYQVEITRKIQNSPSGVDATRNDNEQLLTLSMNLITITKEISILLKADDDDAMALPEHERIAFKDFKQSVRDGSFYE